MMALKFSRKHLGIPYAVFMGLFVVFPLLLIIYYAFTDPISGKLSLVNFIDFFTSNANLTALFISFACKTMFSYPLIVKFKLGASTIAETFFLYSFFSLL